MITYHHGGRIGDLVYALWTMKALGGGKLIVTDFQKGSWSLSLARTMKRFLLAQPYVEDVEFLPYSVRGRIDIDLHEAENDHNPGMFPEWTGPHWPGNCHLAKRYAVHFGFEFDGKPWITAPATETDIAFHCPVRRSLRTWQDWFAIITKLQDSGYAIAVLGDEPPLHNRSVPAGWDLLDTAACIAGAKLFLGTVSCCNAIAEGLGKRRLVEQAEDCFNVTPTVCLNGMSNDEVVAEVKRYL